MFHKSFMFVQWDYSSSVSRNRSLDQDPHLSFIFGKSLKHFTPYSHQRVTWPRNHINIGTPYDNYSSYTWLRLYIKQEKLLFLELNSDKYFLTWNKLQLVKNSVGLHLFVNGSLPQFEAWYINIIWNAKISLIN